MAAYVMLSSKLFVPSVAENTLYKLIGCDKIVLKCKEDSQRESP